MKKITIALCTLISITAAAQKNYSLYKIIHVGDELGWDYVAADELNRNMYFSHATKVLVLSMDNDSIIAEIPKTFGVHGIAFCNELNKGFISNGKANSVTVFDLKNFQVTDTVAINGINPDAIMYDAYSKQVFVFNGKSKDVTVFDAATLKITGSVKLPGKPEFAVTDLNGNVYVNIEDKSELVQMDAVKMNVVNTWPIAPGDEPSGLAIDRKNNLLFSVCSNKQLIVFDIKKGMVTDSVSIGGRVDAVVFDPGTKTLYTSNGEGNVTIIKQKNARRYSEIQTLVTQKGCKTMMLDEKTKKIYLPAAKFDGDTRKILPGTFDILIYN
jgi:DNA-binding beta-propeller fold protein YncE